MGAEGITGAEITIRCLQEEGVKHIFGYPGGAVLFMKIVAQPRVRDNLVFTTQVQRQSFGAAYRRL